MNKIINQDCIEGMKTLPEKSVNTCVTSPPYFGLRDYGYEGQIGLEETPDAYVQKLVELFREVRRVLKDDGTLWLNLGDSYSSQGGRQVPQTRNANRIGGSDSQNRGQSRKPIGELKPKDLIGIPWMVAFALRADGWYLRQDIIWHKPNPMPESITDRCTKSHEYIFLLSKSAKYYFDYEAIQEPIADSTQNDRRLYDENYDVTRPERGFPSGQASRGAGLLVRKSGNKERKERPGAPENFAGNQKGSVPWEGLTRNKRSVWTVTTKPFKEAHFATFPEDLIVPCIKAGCPENGLVLDPFMGAGTTALVAKKLNRNYVGFELNQDYIEIAEDRIFKQIGFFA